MSSSPTTYSACVYNYNYNLYILNRSYIRKISLHLHYRNYVTFAKLSYILWLKLRWVLYILYCITLLLFHCFHIYKLLLFSCMLDEMMSQDCLLPPLFQDLLSITFNWVPTLLEVLRNKYTAQLFSCPWDW